MIPDLFCYSTNEATATKFGPLNTPYGAVVGRSERRELERAKRSIPPPSLKKVAARQGHAGVLLASRALQIVVCSARPARLPFSLADARPSAPPTPARRSPIG